MKCPLCRNPVQFHQGRCESCGAELHFNWFQRLMHYLDPTRQHKEAFIRDLRCGKVPRITSSADLRLYLQHRIGDRELAELFVNLLDKVGRGGCIQFKRGGNGDPYEIEHMDARSFDKLRRREIKKRMREIRGAMRVEKDLAQLVDLMEEISRLSGSTATIWLNTASESDFEKKQSLFDEAVKAMEEAFGDDY